MVGVICETHWRFAWCSNTLCFFLYLYEKTQMYAKIINITHISLPWCPRHFRTFFGLGSVLSIQSPFAPLHGLGFEIWTLLSTPAAHLFWCWLIHSHSSSRPKLSVWLFESSPNESFYHLLPGHLCLFVLITAFPLSPLLFRQKKGYHLPAQANLLSQDACWVSCWVLRTQHYLRSGRYILKGLSAKVDRQRDIHVTAIFIAKSSE